MFNIKKAEKQIILKIPFISHANFAKMFFARKSLNSTLLNQQNKASLGAAVITKLPQMKLFASFVANPAAMFEKAVTDLKKMNNEPDDDLKLQLYGLYKQASSGDVHGNRPKMLEFVARAKYDAWSKNKGMTTEEAQNQYTELVKSLLKQESISDGDGQGLAGNPQKSGGSGGADETTIRVSKQGKVFKIEMNRPDKFNALNWEMYQALVDAMNESNKCRQTSITVLTGMGDYYCAGNDLSNFMRNVKTPDDLRTMADRGEQVLERFVRAHIEHEKPLISLVNGPAIGISVTLMALFDLVIASGKATFHTPFSSLGQSPEGCSSYTFPLLMGPSKACEMLLFDKKLTAHEALECNLVSRVIPQDNFRVETERLIQKLSEFPPESLRVNKQLLRAVHRDALLRVCTHECAVLKQRWLSEECQQALMNFRARKSSKM